MAPLPKEAEDNWDTIIDRNMHQSDKKTSCVLNAFQGYLRIIEEFIMLLPFFFEFICQEIRVNESKQIGISPRPAHKCSADSVKLHWRNLQASAPPEMLSIIEIDPVLLVWQEGQAQQTK